MRTLVVPLCVGLGLGLGLLAACDLQPAPKIQQRSETAGSAAISAPAPPTLQEQRPEPVKDVGAEIPPSPMKRPFDISNTCNDVGVKVAATLIAEARDEAQRQLLENERTRIVRRTAETCTRDKWPAANIRCFLKSETAAQMQECGKDLAAPREDAQPSQG